MQVLITLGSTYGDSVGPFNLYYSTNYGGPDVLIQSNVSIDTLLAGYIATIDDSSVYVKLINQEYCSNNNEVIKYIVAPSPTPSVTISITPSITPSITVIKLWIRRS